MAIQRTMNPRLARPVRYPSTNPGSFHFGFKSPTAIRAILLTRVRRSQGIRLSGPMLDEELVQEGDPRDSMDRIVPAARRSAVSIVRLRQRRDRDARPEGSGSAIRFGVLRG